MKKARRIILISIASFIILVILQLVSSGHGHHVVVKDNNRLTTENKKLTKENNGLKQQVNQLTEKNSELETDSQNMKDLVSGVIGQLDSTSQVVKKIKTELVNEKDKTSRLSNGEQFDFVPIKLPVENDIQR